MLQLKISRTKKRLSNDVWVLPIAIIALMGLLFILNASMRMSSLSFDYGVVRGNIPVLATKFEDLSPSRIKKDQEYSRVSEETTAVIIGANQDLFFGPIKSFTVDYPNHRSKFVVENKNGSAQLSELLGTLDRWIADRWKIDRIANDRIVILVSAASTPVSVVTQVMAELRRSDNFSHVVLANGMF